MRWTKRASRIAILMAATSVVLGVGTVAAQSGEPWWTEQDIADSADVVTMDGSVAVNVPFGLATGSIMKAKENFPDTGEYIGCVITTVRDDGQFLTCTARDAAGEELFCDSVIADGPVEFTQRDQTAILAAASINENSFVGFQVAGGECLSITVSNSSADFLASEGGGTGGVEDCTLNNSVNLGAFGGSSVSVPNNGCAVVVQFAKPFWTYGPGRTMQLQNPSGNTTYPLDFEYAQSCTGAGGAGRFDHAWDDQFLPGISDQCPLFIKLSGNGSGSIGLKYF
jgi:hypothetical protein